MSSANSTKLNLSKAELQILVTLNDPSISFTKPKNKRSECWSNFSQIYHENNPLDYIICLQSKTVLKWTSEDGTRVMSHHNCLNKSISTTPSRQRTISSYCQQSSASKECPFFQKCIAEASVEYCGVDCRQFESIAGVDFMNLAKQLIIAGASLGTSVTVNELLPHPSTIARNFERVYSNLKKQLVSICIHYDGLSLYYVDEQSQLRVFTLACQAYGYETQHAPNLRLFVNKTLEQFGLYLSNNIFI
ncbi:unnamed protein product, partial [Rotaria sordida]